MKKFAVILAGSGVFDGAEIHEATLTLLAIKKLGADYEIFAPDMPQHHVINHITGDEMHEQRNVLVESARIARGNIRSLTRFNADLFDAIIIPGGFGAAKNLCTWAFEGDNCSVNPDAEKAIKGMYAAKKPIGAMCIAPVILGKLFSGTNLTTGDDEASAEFIKKMGSDYTKTKHGEVVIDKTRKIFTAPCYMLNSDIVQIAEGTENLVKEMMKYMD
jgi:enhancing lycopene biosynthesis protein 2